MNCVSQYFFLLFFFIIIIWYCFTLNVDTGLMILRLPFFYLYQNQIQKETLISFKKC